MWVDKLAGLPAVAVSTDTAPVFGCYTRDIITQLGDDLVVGV